MEVLLNYLNSIYPLPQTGLVQFGQMLKQKDLQKRDLLLRAGHICHSIYFIEKGLLRCYYLKGDQEVCSWFMTEGSVIISVESFFQQKQSYESIQALEDCTLWYLSFQELNAIYKTFPEFNYVARVLTERYYCLSEQRLYTMRMMRADERYQNLLNHHADLLLRVPAKYIASYLGISESHFSVIKSRR